jgi:hypothetical protein
MAQSPQPVPLSFARAATSKSSPWTSRDQSGVWSTPRYVHLEVREGTLLVGMGDELDPKQEQPLAAGDSASVPAGMHHFWIASGRTVASMRFIGPFTITYLRVEEAPRPRLFPFGY